jgi:hypothetical protein
VKIVLVLLDTFWAFQTIHLFIVSIHSTTPNPFTMAGSHTNKCSYRLTTNTSRTRQALKKQKTYQPVFLLGNHPTPQ